MGGNITGGERQAPRFLVTALKDSDGAHLNRTQIVKGWRDNKSKLQTIWTDPDFDPTERAFYYVHALEIPTPRWPAFDALKYGTSLPENTELTGQERAHGSPVWHSPEA